MLSSEPTTLFNSPNKIIDLKVTGELCNSVGSKIEVNGDRLDIHTEKIKQTKLSQKLGNMTRTAILLAGPLLHRTGKAEIPIPRGGDKIGERPVNFHIEGLKMLGCNVETTEDYFILQADKLKGANITLNYPSVGATENIIIASTLAKGRTRITNAAVEPEIIDLIKFLQKMGAIIELSTDRHITIEGVDKLYGTEHSVIPDRNQAASFACAGIASKGDVFIENAIQDDLITFLNTVRKMNGEYEVKENGIRFYYDGKLKPLAMKAIIPVS